MKDFIIIIIVAILFFGGVIWLGSSTRTKDQTTLCRSVLLLAPQLHPKVIDDGLLRETCVVEIHVEDGPIMWLSYNTFVETLNKPAGY